MACNTPFDAFRIATEHLTDEIYHRAIQKSVWLNLIQREAFPIGVGVVQSVFTQGRSFPTTDEPAFQQITLAGATFTPKCTVTYKDVPVGFDEDTFYPELFGWKGPEVCQDDLIYNHRAKAFISGYVPAISKHTEIEISNRLQAIYTHYVPKFVANESPQNAAGASGHPPTSPNLTLDESECELTQEMLDSIAETLNEESAFAGDTDGWVTMGDNGPIYTLYIGSMASKRILLNNAELREDYRQAFNGDASMANPFLKRMGASRVIGSFRHLVNPYPPRYTYGAGAYTRVATWEMVAGTKGTVGQTTAAWRAAPFEGAYVLNQGVYHDQIVRPVNMAADMEFPYKSYMGEWKFVVGGQKITNAVCFDPLEKRGAHFAEYHHAAKPILPQYGRFIIFKRCPLGSFECPTCS